MQTIAWILLVVTSLSMIARRKGIIFGLLFSASLIIGFISFGFLIGLGYLALLIIGAVIFHIIEKILSMNIAGEIIKNDLKKKWDIQDRNESKNKTRDRDESAEPLN